MIGVGLETDEIGLCFIGAKKGLGKTKDGSEDDQRNEEKNKFISVGQKRTR